MQLEPGMLVRSKAGRDKNGIYVIISVKDEYVYLADGNRRPVCSAKKKNRKHVQVIYTGYSNSVTENEEIEKTIKRFLRQ